MEAKINAKVYCSASDSWEDSALFVVSNTENTQKHLLNLPIKNTDVILVVEDMQARHIEFSVNRRELERALEMLL